MLPVSTLSGGNISPSPNGRGELFDFSDIII
jgi:hypothetical protein